MKCKLIIITGHPGSGKTTLAGHLARQYHVPYVSKDSIKERIFDALGTKDKEWSLKVSAAAHRVMDDFIETQLRSGGSIIVESNFKSDIDSQRFRQLAQKHNAALLQILCQARGDILFDRWNARIANGTRHKGHVEAVGLDQIKQDLQKPYTPLQLPGELIIVDTSDIANIILPKLDD